MSKTLKPPKQTVGSHVDWNCFTVAVAHMNAADLKEAHRMLLVRKDQIDHETMRAFTLGDKRSPRSRA